MGVRISRACVRGHISRLKKNIYRQETLTTRYVLRA